MRYGTSDNLHVEVEMAYFVVTKFLVTDFVYDVSVVP
jgi:hypothetical protein